MAASGGLNPHTGRTVREVRYRLRDNYTRFYLKYVLPRKAARESGAFRYTPLDRLPGWDAIMGLQFENLVLNNADALIEALGLDKSLIISAAPYRKQMRRGSSTSDGGCQIDLLLQLKQALYVIEVKRRATIDSSVTDDVLEKVKRLPNPRGLSVRPVLVYEGILSPAVNENGVFVAALRASDLLLR